MADFSIATDADLESGFDARSRFDAEESSIVSLSPLSSPKE
jgi:hypothetical protein